MDEVPSTYTGSPAHLEELLRRFAGVKIGLPLLLERGPEEVRAINRVADRLGIMKVADFKLADIGDVMAKSLEGIKKLGFDVAIAHAFVGVRGGLEVLVNRARDLGIRVALVVSMSHEGSREFYDRNLREFLEIARNLGVWGLIAPATRPQVIRECRRFLGGTFKILSPGVGVQGAEFGSAICAGADYEIVGRYVLRSPDPVRAASEVVELVAQRGRECRTNYA
jgi:orotidine-5'-phosphate decarboxylase